MKVLVRVFNTLTNTNLIHKVLDNNNLVQPLAAADDKIGTWNDFIAHDYMPSLKTGMNGNQCPTKKELTTFIDTYGTNITYSISGTYTDTQLVKNLALTTSQAGPRQFRGTIYITDKTNSASNWSITAGQGGSLNGFSASKAFHEPYYYCYYEPDNIEYFVISASLTYSTSMYSTIDATPLNGPWTSELQGGFSGQFSDSGGITTTFMWSCAPAQDGWAIEISII